MEQIKRSQHHESFVTGIIKENPLFVAVLGTCPALAITKSFEAAIGMASPKSSFIVFSLATGLRFITIL